MKSFVFIVKSESNITKAEKNKTLKIGFKRIFLIPKSLNTISPVRLTLNRNL